MKIVVIIPTYNEVDNIEPISRALWALDLPDLVILIVDDNSPDGTADVAARLAENRPGQIELIRRSGKLGLGTAYREGFQRGLAMGADVIIQMDADFSHSPDYIPEMIAQLADYDVVIGSRYVPGGRLDSRWSWGRYLLSWWANVIYTRLILGTHTRDTTAGFKTWRRETLLGLDLTRIHSNGYDFQVEMAYVAEKLGYRILEIPIYFEDRRIGHSKLTIPIKIESALRVWDVWWRHRRLRPENRIVQKGTPALTR